MMLLSKERLAGLLASVALMVCVPQFLSSSPPEWATKPDPSKVERAASDGAAGNTVQSQTLSSSGLGRFRGQARDEASSRRAVKLSSSGDVLAALNELRFVASRPDLESCAGSRSESTALADSVAPRISWTTHENQSALDEFCEAATLRGSIVREATESRPEVCVANLNGVLVIEGQELEPGITVHKIGVDFVDLREGTRALRLMAASTELSSSAEGEPK